MRTAGGLATKAAYPDAYESSVDCSFNFTMDGIQIVDLYGYERAESGNEASLLKAVRQKGPVSAMFYVLPDFFSYRDGIYAASGACIGATGVSHALLIVGFGTENGVDYWLVQNSFGPSWGMGGFGKIQRGINTCGIASCASYPISIIDPSKEKRRPF